MVWSETRVMEERMRFVDALRKTQTEEGGEGARCGKWRSLILSTRSQDASPAFATTRVRKS
jgi:hypothetical protein